MKQVYEEEFEYGGKIEKRLHRIDGPALDYPNSYRAWYRHGLLHREDGPAVEFAGKACSYWLEGRKITDPEQIALMC